MPTLFLSYRRADSMESTSRIYDRLVDCFGPDSVFRDIDSIPLGIPFPDLLQQTLARTNAVLVVIGPSWLTVASPEGLPRLEDAGDFVRLEVESALQLGIPVIPIAVANARLPDAGQLPERLRPLVLRNGHFVRPDPDFHRDMDQLCQKLQEILGLEHAAASRAKMMKQQIESLLAEREARTEAKRIEAKRIEAHAALVRLDSNWQTELGKHPVREAPTIPTPIWEFWIVLLPIFILGVLTFGSGVFCLMMASVPCVIVIDSVRSHRAHKAEEQFSQYLAAQRLYEQRRDAMEELLGTERAVVSPLG